MLGKRIRGLRLAFGWSQVELSGKLNVSKQAVSNWENGNIQPSIDMLVLLSETLHVTTDYLLGLDDSPRLDVSGLSATEVAHVAFLIDDLRKRS